MNVDIIIIAIYMLFIFIVGLYYGKDTKTTRDYAVANKKYSLFILTMTLIATTFGAGSTVGDAVKIAEDGIIFPLSMISSLAMVVYVRYFADNYFDQRFDSMISAGDIALNFFGKKAEFITSLFGVIVCTTVIGGQLTALGNLFSSFFGMGYEDIVLISSAVVILYVSFGGVKSVTMTDVIQAVIIFTAIPFIAFWLANECGGISQILNNIPQEKLAIRNHPKFYEYSFLFICSWLPFLWLQPSVVQRFLMTEDKNKIKVMYNTIFFVRIGFTAVITLIGLSAFHLFPDIPAKSLIATVLKKSLPVGMCGLFIVAVMAASMSTADSALNAASVLLIHNMLCRKFNINNENKKIALMRLASIIMGSMATYVAMYNLDIVELILVGFSVWGGGIMVPIVGAIVKMPTPKYSFFIPAITALTTCLSCQFIGVKGFYIPSYTMLSGLISYIICLIYNKMSENAREMIKKANSNAGI